LACREKATNSYNKERFDRVLYQLVKSMHVGRHRVVSFPTDIDRVIYCHLYSRVFGRQD